MTDRPRSISDSMKTDYIAPFTAHVEIEPARTCLVIVDLQCGTGARETGLGRLLTKHGRLDEAEYRFSRIEQLVLPNSMRLLECFREHDLRRVFLTYGSEVSDYSDLSNEMRALCGIKERAERLAASPVEQTEPQPEPVGVAG